MISSEKDDWMDSGNCKGSSVNFFPKEGESAAPAKKVCETCKVKPECYDYVMSDSSLQGVWAGMSDRDRRKERSRNPVEVCRHGLRLWQCRICR